LFQLGFEWNAFTALAINLLALFVLARVRVEG
jgi:hypothetical protein